ncbi:aminomethyltransferase [Sarracenia purpurea var. burkii]
MRGSDLWQLAQLITRHRHPARRCSTAKAELKKTVLHELHVANDGEMVPSFELTTSPQYRGSIIDSAMDRRENSVLSVVSPPCDLISLKGKNGAKFREKLIVADSLGLSPGARALTVSTNEKGEVIDDLMISKTSDDNVFAVTNLGSKDRDVYWIRRTEGGMIFGWITSFIPEQCSDHNHTPPVLRSV